MKKKILFVINTMGRAGAETAMLAMMKRLNPEQYDISLYVLMGQGEMINELPEYVQLLNRKYCDISVLDRAGQAHMVKKVLSSALCRLNGIRLLPYMAVNAVRMIRRHNFQKDKLLWRLIADGARRMDTEYDLAIAYLEGGSAYYVADYVNARSKAAFIHIDYGMSGYTRELDRDCYNAFDRVFTVSDEVKSSFVKAYPECAGNTEVFHNFLDTQRIRSMAATGTGFNDEYEGIRILTVGRITYQKAYDVAVAAMKLVKDAKAQARWYILGDGPLREEISELIRQNGLEDSFILLGATDNPYPYYTQADIYVHATRFEGKSIAIQEAQLLGCAIIASDCNGNREQIESGRDGILCALTPAAIAESILLLINDSQQRSMYAHAAAMRKINHEEDIEKIYRLL